MIREFFFNPIHYPFDAIISQAFLNQRLSALHLNTANCERVVEQSTDQSTCWHRRYYKLMHEPSAMIEFKLSYIDFLTYILPYEFPGEKKFIIQTIPNLRIQFPGNKGVGAYHRDRDYQHNPAEINVYLPLTPALKTNTIQTETEEGKEDFIPLEVPSFGKGFIWSGIDLLHGNEISMEYWTRVSLDFRFIPGSRYKPTRGESVNTHTKFEVGGYYTELSV